MRLCPQAATTGEAVMEEALASLAQRDPSRFQRLNQRMQVRLRWRGCARGGAVGPRVQAHLRR